jgi:hypothetical protein
LPVCLFFCLPVCSAASMFAAVRACRLDGYLLLFLPACLPWEGFEFVF